MKNVPDLFRRGAFDFSGSPYRNLVNLQRQMDHMFNDFWDGHAFEANTPALEAPVFAPSCDIDETDSHYVLSFDLPGVKKEDIKIDLKEGTLAVSGERKSETEKKDKSSYRSERFYGSFSRSFRLPAGAKPEQVEANYTDGVLRIAVPKTKATQGEPIKIGEGKAGFWEKLLGHKKEEAETTVPLAGNNGQEKRASGKVA